MKIGLVPKLIITIILGILIGLYTPLWFCRAVVTASGFFGTFLKFVIPLLILAFVTMGIADLTQGAGKLLLITVAIAYASTLLGGTASFIVSSKLFPGFMNAEALEKIAATAENSVPSFFSLSIPPVLDTLSAVVLAFMSGLKNLSPGIRTACSVRSPREERIFPAASGSGSPLPGLCSGILVLSCLMRRPAPWIPKVSAKSRRRSRPLWGSVPSLWWRTA